MTALSPDNYDFVSNFDTLWAVFLGAILATIGGFAATQLEWYFERKRRERHAALFFSEILSTLGIILDIAKTTKGRGDPFGPITLRMFRSARGEIDLYNRNRETLYALHNAEIRARIHTLMLRLGSPIDGIFDATEEIRLLDAKLKDGIANPDQLSEARSRIESLRESREGSFEFITDTMAQIRPLVADLQPLSGHSYDRTEALVRGP